MSSQSMEAAGATASEEDLFAAMFVRAADASAASFGYAPPALAAVAGWMAAISQGTRQGIGRGIREGLVQPAERGVGFTLGRAAPARGPYAWFSRNRAPETPSPNWEYFFQVAEFVRIRSALGPAYEIGFEDGLMDVSVRREGVLLWYVEVKVSRAQTDRLLRALNLIREDVNLVAPDRGNDPLRKAKYLVRHRPPHMSLVGGEDRRHFDVSYREPASFDLRVRRDGPEDALSGE